MIKNRRKKGTTLVEVLVSLVIMALVTTVVFFLFSNSNRTISETEIKSQLQQDVQSIQERFSKLGMESEGISNIVFEPGSTDKIKTLELKSITTTENISGVATTIYNIFNFNVDNGKLILQTSEVSKTDSTAEVINVVQTKELSDNVKYISVKPTNSSVADLKLAKSININILVEKSKSRITKTLEGETIVTFRNKN